MAVPLTFRFTVTDDTGDTLTGSIPATSDALEKIEVALDSTLSNKEVTLPVTLANCAAIAVQSPIAATVKTNSSSAPDDTFSVIAGGFLGGVKSSTVPVPATVNLTKLFITTAVAVAGGKIRIWLLSDVTP